MIKFDMYRRFEIALGMSNGTYPPMVYGFSIKQWKADISERLRRWR